ncbi:MAG: dsbA 2 [Burkholderiaceae bacterium]|nr:dsbA 2 [Burkholderiaceae bacterium]
MKLIHGFKIQLNIASFVGAIFIYWVCLGGVQTARANESSMPVQVGVDTQINSQGAPTEWQMPMDVASVVNAGRVQTQGTVEVVEFFWYGCPHCAIFEPSFVQWRTTQPQAVQIITLPISWNKTMVTHQRMYFTLEALNRLDLHDQVFKDVAAAKDSLATSGSALAWAQKQGISPSQWRAIFNSAAVTQKMQFAQAQFERFGLTGVPAVIVDGRYQVLLSANTIETLDALVKQRLSKAK